MPNTLLTPTAVTREALRVLHQKLNFVGSITREYDDSFARQGAKVGDTLKVRLPNQYVVRTGATLAAQDTTETSLDLKVQTQKGVDLNFTSVDLTMNLDDFSDRVLEPAMSVLAANIEADAMSMYKDVHNQVNNQGVAATFAKVLQGRKTLVDNLAPLAGRTCNLNTQDNVDLVDALKGLFNDQGTIAKQNREGFMGRTAGFDFMENTLWPSHGRGAANTAYVVNGAGQTGASLTVGTGAGAAVRGDVFTIAGVFRVHPETKAATGILQQFTLTADFAGGAGSLAISPAIVTSGPLACAMLTASCASGPPSLPAAPRIETPAEAARPCSLYVLPATPTQADLEIGYATRGAQLLACDAARRLAVQTHEAEHELEDRLGVPAGAKPGVDNTKSFPQCSQKARRRWCLDSSEGLPRRP